MQIGNALRRGTGVAAVLLALGVTLASCGDSGGQGAGADDNSGGVLTLGLFNWAENIAVSNMWAVLLEKQGYDVEQQNLDKSPNFVGVAQGDLDLSLEVWLPTTDQHLVEEYEGDLVIGDPWYEGTRLGVVVPSYVESVQTIGDLAEHKDEFSADGQPRIVGIDQGASITGLVDDAISTYALDQYEQVNSSEQAMLTTLGNAVQDQESVAVALWNPHWAFAEWDLKYLEDPEGVFGESESIHYMHRTGLEEDHPEVVRWLDNWQMTDPQLSELMAEVRDAGEARAGAEAWIEDNRDVIDEWLQS